MTVVSDAWNSEAIVEVRIEEVTGVVTATPFRVVSVTPNPFNPTMAVHFTLPAAQPVTAAVYSVAGGRVVCSRTRSRSLRETTVSSGTA